MERNRIDRNVWKTLSFGDKIPIECIELEVTTKLNIMRQLKMFLQWLYRGSAKTHFQYTVHRVAKRLDLVMIGNMKTRQVEFFSHCSYKKPKSKFECSQIFQPWASTESKSNFCCSHVFYGEVELPHQIELLLRQRFSRDLTTFFDGCIFCFQFGSIQKSCFLLPF
jgi:hypothetical protein